MRKEWPEDWYSPHILVICNNQEQAQHLCEQTNDQIRHLGLYGDGWRATAMYDGLKTSVREESHLFHTDKNIIHPFMRAKTRGGRCDKKSARILFVVDMAIRGMNCWPLLYVVDIKRGNSINVQVQTKGRDGRWPSTHKHLFDDPRFGHFCTGRYYRPESGKYSGQMKEAYSFILEMEKQIEEAGLLHWNDLLEGKTVDNTWVIQGSNPFSTGDRVQVDSMLGQMKQSGHQVTPDDIESIVKSLPGSMPKDRRDRVVEHIKNVTDTSEDGKNYRARLLNIDDARIEMPICHEEPKKAEDYTTAELISFAQSYVKWSACINKILPEIADEKSAIRFMVAQELRDRDIRLYRQVDAIFQLQTEDGKIGILNRIANALGTELIGRSLAQHKDRGAINRKINTAAAKITGMAGVPGAAKNHGPLDQPAYHYIFMLPNVQKRMKEIAIASLMRSGVLPAAASLYEDVLGGNEDVIAAE